MVGFYDWCENAFQSVNVFFDCCDNKCDLQCAMWRFMLYCINPKVQKITRTVHYGYTAALNSVTINLWWNWSTGCSNPSTYWWCINVLCFAAYMGFMWMLLLVAYGQREPNAFFLNQHIRKSFTKDVSDSMCLQDVFTWASNSLLTNLFGNYPGRTLSQNCIPKPYVECCFSCHCKPELLCFKVDNYFVSSHKSLSKCFIQSSKTLK